MRSLEREASLGDPMAAMQLRMIRCRMGECCAHALVPKFEDSILEAYSTIDTVHTNMIDNTAEISIRIIGTSESMSAALAWITDLFGDSDDGRIEKIGEKWVRRV